MYIELHNARDSSHSCFSIPPPKTCLLFVNENIRFQGNFRQRDIHTYKTKTIYAKCEQSTYFTYNQSAISFRSTEQANKFQTFSYQIHDEHFFFLVWENCFHFIYFFHLSGNIYLFSFRCLILLILFISKVCVSDERMARRKNEDGFCYWRHWRVMMTTNMWNAKCFVFFMSKRTRKKQTEGGTSVFFDAVLCKQ